MTDGGGDDGREPDPHRGSQESPAPQSTDGPKRRDSPPDHKDTSGQQRSDPHDSSAGAQGEVGRSGGQPAPDRPPVRGDGPDDGDEMSEWLLLVRDVGTSIGAVLLLFAYVFAISGVWPPMVAIESGSMEPNMDVNDLVFVMETDRFQPEAAHNETGVVTARDGRAADYRRFGGPGDVIVFAPSGDGGQTPIIHRAMFWVEEGENWVAAANDSYLGAATTCDAPKLRDVCPAPHDGFITKGDNNPVYDQDQGSVPVKPEWVVGTAEMRIPGLGWLRLQFQ